MAYTNTNSKDEEEATNDYSSYWQSIPDPPPTPVDNNIKVSTDNSNGDDNDIKVSEVEPQRHNNRKKKNAFRDVTNSAATSTADNNNNNNPADDDDGGIDKCVATLRSIGEVGIIEKKSSKKSKRRKKRKSLLLPSDEGTTLLLPLAASCLDNNQKSTEWSSINNNNSSSYNKQVLTQLVRDYCQLPNEQRINSTQSNQIETLSSYPMPGKIVPFVNNASTNNKHEFLLRVQPIVQEMEIKKKRDIQETKLATQCEVRKERGGFCYYDINSGQQVMPQEYKVRYCRMVDEQRKKRRLVVNEEEDKVGGISEELVNVNQTEVNSGQQVMPQEYKVRYCRMVDEQRKKRRLVVNEEEDKVGGISEELVNVNQTEVNHNNNKQEEKHDNNNFKDNEQGPTNADDSNMEIDESMEDSMNMSHDDSTMSRGKEDDDKQCPEKIAKSSPLDNVSSSSKEEAQGTTDGSQSQPASNTSNPLSRMPPSDDPRVIAARKTLFTAIDTALANYSAEILAIEAAGNEGR